MGSTSILDILMLDHIILTATSFFSFRNNKTLHYPILTNPKQTHAETCGMKKQHRKGGDVTHERINQ
jgi:hypothetical protein